MFRWTLAESRRALGAVCFTFGVACASRASADVPAAENAPSVSGEPSPGPSGGGAAPDVGSGQGAADKHGEDPTGGAYTSPTLLFIPAAAVPKWNARLILSTELQSPSDVDAQVRPGLGIEVGLPGGVTLGAGSDWVGGDVNPNSGKADFNLGLSPYAQARVHVAGRDDGEGFQLGTSLTYKFVGFEGDPGEMELAVSGQYRMQRFEVGLQGVIGKDFGSTDADSEVHTYVLYRVIPELGIGAAGQMRGALVSQPGESTYDVVAGGLASLTLGRYQIGALAGASSVGLAQGRVGGLGQLLASARF
jgi:hypothetical protein